MAFQGKKTKSLRKDNLPNLKICVDNTDEINKSSSESSEEGEISDDERPLCVEAKLPRKNSDPKQPAINRKMASPIPSDEEPALIVDFDDLETFGVTKKPKKYENKESGNFELGFDPTSKENLEKREERAKRFGIKSAQFVPLTEDNIKKLYESLGISRETKGERGIRLDAIHLRGCDDMSTNDIFAYFQLYAPSNIEWIDDTSCNVIWADDKSAARAMWFTSDDPNDPNLLDAQTEKTTHEKGNEVDEEKKKEEERQEEEMEERQEEKMEESDPDELDLLSSDEEEGQSERRKKKRSKVPEKENAPKAEENGEEMDTEEERKHESETDNSEIEERKARLLRAKRILPPGRWRVGHPLPQNQYLFLRFATKADRKLQGAERRSRYYQRYGNPNYGGATGLISNSRKQRIRQARYRAVEEEAQRVISQHAQSRDFFKNRRLRAWSSDEEEQDDFGEEDYGHDEQRDVRGRETMSRRTRDLRPQASYPEVAIKRRWQDDDKEELDMEAELGELLRQIPEKRKMRMYADDEEELAKRKRMQSAEINQKPDLRSRLGNQGASLSNSRQARYRRQQREQRHYRDRSESPDLLKTRRYEKITIQVDPDDV